MFADDIIFYTYLQAQPNGNLVFPPFRAEDYRQEVHAQVYVCMARNSVGSIHSRDVNVRAGKKEHTIPLYWSFVHNILFSELCTKFSPSLHCCSTVY